MFKWVDRNLWSVPTLVFLLTELALSVWSAMSRTPVLLAAARLTARQQIYSSLTGSSSGLLGLALATVAILVALGPRPRRAGEQPLNETRLARARADLAGSLLAVAFFLLVILITATLAAAVDSKPTGNPAITTIIESASLASILGLLVSGLGLALVIVERAQE